MLRRLAGSSLLLACAGVSSAGAQAPEWTLRPAGFSVGGHTDDERYALSRVVGAQRLADGRIVIADRYAQGVRMYTAEGEYVARVGGDGDGPEEFRTVLGLGRCEPNRIVAFDLGWASKVYDEDLAFIEAGSISVPQLSRSVYQLACGPSGLKIVSGWGVPDETTVGLFQARAPVLLLRGDSVIHDFGRRLSSERIGVPPEGDASADPHYAGGASGPHPFGRQGVMAIGSDRVYLGDGADYSIEVFDLTGAPLPPLRWSGPTLEITDADVQAFEAAQVARVSEDRKPAMRRAVQDMPRLERFPAYDKLMVDIGGRLWVRSFLRPTDDHGTWWVFGDQAGVVGRLSLPLTTTLLEAGADYVLIVERDELGVETVRLMDIEKPG